MGNTNRPATFPHGWKRSALYSSAPPSPPPPSSPLARRFEVPHEIGEYEHRHELQQRRQHVQRDGVPHPPVPEGVPQHLGQAGIFLLVRPPPRPLPLPLRCIRGQRAYPRGVRGLLPLVDPFHSRHLGRPERPDLLVTRSCAIAPGGRADVARLEDLRRAELEEGGHVQEQPRGETRRLVLVRGEVIDVVDPPAHVVLLVNQRRRFPRRFAVAVVVLRPGGDVVCAPAARGRRRRHRRRRRRRPVLRRLHLLLLLEGGPVLLLILPATGGGAAVVVVVGNDVGRGGGGWGGGSAPGGVSGSGSGSVALAAT